MQFQVNADVTRLTDEAGRVTGYTTDLKVNCIQCGVPFRWLGLKYGSHFAEPRASVDNQSLRAPIEPAYVTEILGEPLMKGRA